MTREVARGVSVSGEWFHNDAKNSFERNNVLRPGTYSNGTVTNPSYKRGHGVQPDRWQGHHDV